MQLCAYAAKSKHIPCKEIIQGFKEENNFVGKEFKPQMSLYDECFKRLIEKGVRINEYGSEKALINMCNENNDPDYIVSEIVKEWS